MSGHEHDERRSWRDEDLLEWLLDEQARGEVRREAFESQPELAERLRDLEAFLGDCRHALTDEARSTDQADSAELVERIFASTTREDISWRGDLRLVTGFLRQRLQASLLLRVVAASLLLHVIALPVLAYYTLVVISQPQIRIAVQSETPDLPYGLPEPEPDREVVGPATDEFGPPSVAKRLRRERLARKGRVNLDGISAMPRGTEVWYDSLGLVLWCEQLMDELAEPDVDPGRERLLEFALTELGQRLATVGDGALARLAASAWLRAGAGGWEKPDARLTAACEKLLNDGKFLTGEAWEETYREADRVEQGR